MKAGSSAASPGCRHFRSRGATNVIGMPRAASRSKWRRTLRYAMCRDRWRTHVKRVTGIGGIFFHAKDPVALRDWYKTHLGIDVQGWGGTAFNWADAAGNAPTGSTVWSIGAAEGDQFAPG